MESEAAGAVSYPDPPLESKRADTGGLKLATIAPGSMASLPDMPAVEFGKKPDPFLGCTIDDRYKVEAILGEGGMGVVYRCRHKIIDKKVAMKILRADLARDTEVTERFLIEAKAASSIGNPHIIDISDFGQLPDGSTYFVMEYLEGTPLSSLIDGGAALGIQRIVHIGRQLAEGLAAAHDVEIVHRDLKPDNIFLIDRGKEKDFVKILDFGIAKVSTAEHGITRAGSVFGTPHYMSPEQAAGAPVDHRVDIYALGVILYEMASGKVPFDADNFMGILTQHMYKAPVPIRALVPQPNEVPPGLEAIILKCLSKRPEQRYQDMNELVEDLNRLETGNIPTAVPEMMQRSGGFNVPADYFNKGAMPAPVPADPGRRGRSKWPLYAGVAGVVAAIAIVGTIFAVSPPSSATQPTSTPAPETLKTETPVTTAAATVTPKPAEPRQTEVILAVAPLEAHVFRGEEDLGASPVSLKVPEGETVDVEIRAEGYKAQKLSLDGKETKHSIKLEKEAKAAGSYVRPVTKPTSKPEPKTHSKPKPKPQIGGSDIVNPWN
ncbi:MAG: protein kinase [Myxococcales bacterium]|nr:protein kinase [Myxococcales bacterium]